MATDISRMTPDELRKMAATLERKAANDEITKSLEGRIAIALHDSLCRHNHTDGCSWGYETQDGHQWGSDAHRRWRATSRKLLRAGDFSDHVITLPEEPT